MEILVLGNEEPSEKNVSGALYSTESGGVPTEYRLMWHFSKQVWIQVVLLHLLLDICPFGKVSAQSIGVVEYTDRISAVG